MTALIGLFSFLFALANPALFLGVFMLAAFVIYFVCSFKFLNKGLLNPRPLATKLRDWIKVNAYVALPFGIMMFMSSFNVIKNPASLDDHLKQMSEMQQKMGMPVQNAALNASALQSVFYIMLFFSVVILVHIMLTFTFLKKYESLFEPKEESLH
jgi:hypothetical protein